MRIALHELVMGDHDDEMLSSSTTRARAALTSDFVAESSEAVGSSAKMTSGFFTAALSPDRDPLLFSTGQGGDWLRLVLDVERPKYLSCSSDLNIVPGEAMDKTKVFGAEKFGSKLGFCMTNPTRRRHIARSPFPIPVTTSPADTMVPLVGTSRPDNSINRVVFPEPDSPFMSVNFPSSISILKLSNTFVEPNDLLRSRPEHTTLASEANNPFVVYSIYLIASAGVMSFRTLRDPTYPAIPFAIAMNMVANVIFLNPVRHRGQ